MPTEAPTETQPDFDPEQEAQTPRASGSTEVERRVGSAAWLDFDDNQIALVKSTIMPPEATAGETYMLLELAARYQLDPFAREIWAAKMKGQSGTKGGVAILIGRDGLLKLASRDVAYRGMTARAVHESDEFELLDEPVTRKVTGGSEVWSYVRHKAGKPQERGALIGGFCEVYKDGEPASFFYASLEEYMPQSEAKLQYSPWKQQQSVMIVKCAIVNALRLAVRISGLYVEDEMTNVLDRGELTNQPAPADFGDDDELAQYLALLFAAAESAKPGSWLPGRQRSALAEATEADDPHLARETLALELAAHIEKNGGTVPERPEPLEGEVVVEEPEVEVDDGLTPEERQAKLDAEREERLHGYGVPAPDGEAADDEPPPHIEGQEELL